VVTAAKARTSNTRVRAFIFMAIMEALTADKTNLEALLF
jgi:hypothetical protein